MDIEQVGAPVRLLLVEDNPGDADYVREALLGEQTFRVALTHVPLLAKGLAHVREGGVDAVLLDLSLPDSWELEGLSRLRSMAPEVPIVVLTGAANESLGVRAVAAGAQDYLLKSEVSGPLLSRAVRYAVERHRLYGDAQRAIRARDDFISIAAHELRTPLSALVLLLTSADRALHQDTSSTLIESIGERLTRAVRQTERLTRLVDNLLDVSRIETGQLALQLEPFNLFEAIEEHLQRCGGEAERAGCTLELRATARPVGRWDRARVDQVLANLLSNAIKYGAGQAVVVNVEEDPSWARFSVQDHGIGIAPEDLVRIFGRFERSTSVRHYGGLGLGLYVARQIVDAHGGSIRMESHVGQGSTVIVELPRSRSMGAALG
jgi:signal transduction histidine kinase